MFVNIYPVGEGLQIPLFKAAGLQIRPNESEQIIHGHSRIIYGHSRLKELFATLRFING